MNILKVKQGNEWIDIPSIIGPPGEDYVLTAEDKAEIAGMVNVPVTDVQVNGTSIVSNSVANVLVPTKASDLINDSNFISDANYNHTDNNYTTSEKEKLSGIETGAKVNVNADWNATSGDAQILNKPTNVSNFTNDVGYLTEHQDISGKADKSEIPTKVSQLQNDSGYLTSFTEIDPTVPAWAKAANKPSYTAAEVGAPTVAEMNTAIGEAVGQINSFDIAVVQTLPTQNISTHTIYLVPKTGETNDVYDEYIYINSKWEMIGNTQIDLSNYALKNELPTKVSELSNDSGYLTSYTETDPTVPQWAKASTKPSYTATEVGALPSDTHIPNTTAELTNDAGFITVEEVPEVPVQDVQINGSSIVENGVANVPIAASDTFGVVKVGSDGSIVFNNGNQLKVNAANSSGIKSGTEASMPIAPALQHESTFYGLAKAAGDTTQSASSNAVGAYTDEAKVVIQKMLGIYEAPWELIREDTATNATEADIIINADSNGQAFELTDVRLVLVSPQQDTAFSKADYGRVRFYYQAGAYDFIFIGAYTQAANASAKVSYIAFEQSDGMLVRSVMPNTSRGGMGPLQTYATEDGTGHFVLTDTPRVYSKINITKVTGSLHYILYGRRA